MSLAALFLIITANAQTATITLSSEKQAIRGFGGMNHKVWTGYDLTKAERDLAFGNGDGQIGMTILRIWISDDKSQWPVEIATAKDVLSRGGIVFATPWNPPDSMRESFGTTSSGTTKYRLKTSSYSSYADHLNSFIKTMGDSGVDVYAVSLQNEPDWGYDWTWGTATEMYNLLKSIGGKLNTRTMTAESFCFNKSYYNPILNDTSALNKVDIFGTHFYGTSKSSSDTTFQYSLFEQKGTEKEFWMTEVYTDSINDTTRAQGSNTWPLASDVAYEINRAMTLSNMSAYVWWYIKRYYGPLYTSRQSPSTVAGTVSKVGWCMAHYAKYIRPGYVRVDATRNPTSDVYLSAYKGNDSVVVVILNRNTSSKTLTISIPGTAVTSFTKYTTSSSKSLQNDGAVSVNNDLISVTLDAQSVVTLAGGASSTEVSRIQNSCRSGILFNRIAKSVIVKGNGRLDCSVFDLRGNVVEKMSGENGVIIGKMLHSGTYVIKAVSDGQSRNYRFVK